MTQDTLWDTIHTRYSRTDWIDKPSLFAEWAIRYFPKSGKLLDLGAGQGQDSRFFARNGYHVTSTDLSEKALKLSKEKASQEQLHMAIQYLDLSKPFPFTDNSFEIVYAHLSLHYFTDAVTKQLFAEIYRVLHPEGILALLVNSSSDPEYGTGTKTENGVFEVEPGFVKRFFSEKSLEYYTSQFESIILDNKGETYKDNAIGTKNLLRFIGKKN